MQNRMWRWDGYRGVFLRGFERERVVKRSGPITWLIVLILIASCNYPQAGAKEPLKNTGESFSVQGGGCPGSVLPGKQGMRYAPGEVLVKFQEDTDKETIKAIIEDEHLKIIQPFSSPNLFLMRITDGSSVEAVIERLKDREAVKYAEPNYSVSVN